MARILVHVEGQTEEAFVNEVLADHLYGYGYTSVSARIMGNARQRAGRGGIKPWSVVRDEILRHLNSDRDCLATLMVDYYGLPSAGARAWPGRQAATNKRFEDKANSIETLLETEVALRGGGSHPMRFIPYIMMHEFEGLLFSDCQVFADAIGEPGLSQDFQKIRDDFDSPEEINDSPITAPSKRVVGLKSDYEKPLHGNFAILEMP
mgnify:CR=1 FL=1